MSLSCQFHNAKSSMLSLMRKQHLPYRHTQCAILMTKITFRTDPLSCILHQRYLISSALIKAASQYLRAREDMRSNSYQTSAKLPSSMVNPYPSGPSNRVELQMQRVYCKETDSLHVKRGVSTRGRARSTCCMTPRTEQYMRPVRWKEAIAPTAIAVLALICPIPTQGMIQ